MISLFGIVLMLKWLVGSFSRLFPNIFCGLLYPRRIDRFFAGRLHYDFPLWKNLLSESIRWAAVWFWSIRLAARHAYSRAAGRPVSSFVQFPFRILMGMSMISGLLTQPLFPFSFASPSVKRRTCVVYQRTIKWFCLISFPLMSICLACRDPSSISFLESIHDGTPALMILSLAIFSILFPYSIRSIQRAGPPKDFLIIMFRRWRRGFLNFCSSAVRLPQRMLHHRRD